MKKTKAYLESSALWNLYYVEEGADLVEHCLDNPQLECLTSIWSQLELERGIKKRMNQDELTSQKADSLRVFIETDLKRLTSKKNLVMIPVLEECVIIAKRYIRDYNLYASDALQLASAVHQGCKTVLVDDYHFKRLPAEIEQKEGIFIVSTSTNIDSFHGQYK